MRAALAAEKQLAVIELDTIEAINSTRFTTALSMMVA
jgi:hypothetical protein